MIQSKRNIYLFFLIILLIPILCVLHLTVGQIDISLGDFLNSISNYDGSIEHIIAKEIRIPRLVITLIAGAALSLSGMLMQTLFNNPLAGPYVLGINSGSSLFVAFTFMTGIPFLTSDLGTVASALIGAFIFGMIITSFSLMVRSQVSLLLIGLMLGSFTSAVVYILQTLSSADELKAFTMWAMGSLQHVELGQLPMILLIFVLGLIATLFIIKPLNAMVLGERDAILLGVNIRSLRIVIIAITAVLTGLITAYCGPIAFIGLAIPNLVRILFKTQNHRSLIIASVLLGGAFLLICDIVIQLLESHLYIPINAFTSLIGAPFIVFLVIKRLA